MKAILMGLLLFFLLLLFIVVFLLSYVNSHQNKVNDERPQRSYIHYANNPNKVWGEGPFITILNPCPKKEETASKQNPNKTISKIQVLSTDHNVHNGIFFTEWFETEIRYLCKITYKSGRTEVRTCDASFLNRYSDAVV